MEKIISEEEKIRRAIEISKRRNQTYFEREAAKININNKSRDYKLFKKMILQIIICLLIYFVFYLISTTNYLFSDQVLKSTTNILEYDINLKKVYEEIENFFNKKFKSSDMELNNVNDSNVNNVMNTDMSEVNNNVNVSLTSNNVVVEDKENNKNDKEQKKDEMKENAEKVKKICDFKKPLEGTITSEFGEREVILEGMTSDHKGIDIAAKSGTNIKAAMSGTVSVAEENSEYGKFIKLVDGDVMTVYAHCKNLKVKKGEKVKIGQTIATVGTTGNSTGPHLHFEVRLKDEYINPRYIIKF